MNLTHSTKRQMIETLEQALAIVKSLPAQTPCIKCENFTPEREFCEHWNSKVPQDAQAVGCEQYIDLVPF
jgi:hypothetical protein